MGASDILNLLRQSSLRVSLSGTALNVLPVERLTDETRTLIRDNKPEILTALAGEAAELTQLVRQCGDAYGFTEAEHVDALAAALADSESALTCFRAIAAELDRGACYE
ncbi:MAG TPA: hypothetical protein DCQ77_06350 [Betaproteobacteria bacterium]|nr:hypothetical protein [Betaproteobacteria bacterium]